MEQVLSDIFSQGAPSLFTPPSVSSELALGCRTWKMHTPFWGADSHDRLSESVENCFKPTVAWGLILLNEYGAWKP